MTNPSDIQDQGSLDEPQQAVEPEVADDDIKDEAEPQPGPVDPVLGLQEQPHREPGEPAV